MPLPTRFTVALVLAAAALAACSGDDAERQAAGLGGGSPQRGREAIQRYHCGSCHTIQGIPGANGVVGPPLDGIASRPSLAGRLPNTPDNLRRWIQSPQSIVPGNVMPDMGIGERDARDISAYLYAVGARRSPRP